MNSPSVCVDSCHGSIVTANLPMPLKAYASMPIVLTQREEHDAQVRQIARRCRGRSEIESTRRRSARSSAAARRARTSSGKSG